MARGQSIRKTWYGQVTWAAGQQATSRYLVQAGEGKLTTAAAAPTSWASLLQLDLEGYLYAGAHIHGVKVAHADTMTFTARYTHAGMGIHSLPSLAPQWADGHYNPFTWTLGVAPVRGNLPMPASRGGIHDSQTLNGTSSMDVMFSTHEATPMINNLTAGLIVPYTRLAFSAFWTAGATVLAGTNTWDIWVTLYACR